MIPQCIQIQRLTDDMISNIAENDNISDETKYRKIYLLSEIGRLATELIAT